MTLEKAIEIVEKWYAGGYATRIEEMNPAIKMLIEAGAFIEKWHDQLVEEGFLPLPGEDSIIDNTRSLHTIRNILESPLGRECGQ